MPLGPRQQPDIPGPESAVLVFENRSAGSSALRLPEDSLERITKRPLDPPVCADVGLAGVPVRILGDDPHGTHRLGVDVWADQLLLWERRFQGQSQLTRVIDAPGSRSSRD